MCPQARLKYCKWCDQVKKRACSRAECKAKASAGSGVVWLPGDVAATAAVGGDAAPGVPEEPPPGPSDASEQRDQDGSESEYDTSDETGDEDSSDDDGY